MDGGDRRRGGATSERRGGRAGGVTRMSEMQYSFAPGGTVAAFPTSSLVFSPPDVGFAALVCPKQNERCISDIQERLAAADVGFAASVPSSRNERCVSDIRWGTDPQTRRLQQFSAPYFCKPAGRNSFRGPVSTNPPVATVFGPKTSLKLRKTAGLWKWTPKKCGKQRVCRLEAPEKCGKRMFYRVTPPLPHRQPVAGGQRARGQNAAAGHRSANPRVAAVFGARFNKPVSCSSF